MPEQDDNIVLSVVIGVVIVFVIVFVLALLCGLFGLIIVVPEQAALEGSRLMAMALAAGT